MTPRCASLLGPLTLACYKVSVSKTEILVGFNHVVSSNKYFKMYKTKRSDYTSLFQQPFYLPEPKLYSHCAGLVCQTFNQIPEALALSLLTVTPIMYNNWFWDLIDYFKALHGLSHCYISDLLAPYEPRPVWDPWPEVLFLFQRTGWKLEGVCSLGPKATEWPAWGNQVGWVSNIFYFEEFFHFTWTVFYLCCICKEKSFKHVNLDCEKCK